MNIYYRNLNRINKVTGTCHYLRIEFKHNPSCNLNLLVDVGATQDSKLSFSQLYEINGKPHDIDYSKLNLVVLSHSHA